MAHSQQLLLPAEASAPARGPRWPAGRGRVDWPAAAIPLAIVTLAAVLRLWSIQHDPENPFYDAAVRSMGLSWHNFFFGALDPSGRLAIDKPPIDLWLQVGATKLLGFNRTALALPEALGGIAAVALLYGAVTSACGRLAGACAALTLAVLPIAVLTARSDTMDSVMSALLVGALWAAVMAVKRRAAGWLVLSAALVGLAFNVKLTQALVPLPALALLWWAAVYSGRRLALASIAAAVLVAVAMAWALLASLTPLSARPFPMGSHTGSIFRAMFVFNGIERLTGAAREVTPYGFSSPPGALRLLDSGNVHYGSLIGAELVATLLLLIAAAALWLGERRGRPPRAGAARTTTTTPLANRLTVTLLVWLATGYLLFSFMGHLEPRYLETLSPAVAGLLGISIAYLLARTARAPILRIALIATASLALLAGPAEASIDLVEENRSDANPTGSGGQYGSYLRTHQGGAFYEAAASNPQVVVGLIAQDGRPVLVLRSVDGVLVSVSELRALVRAGAVRYVILAHPCAAGRHCTPTTAWTVRNATAVRPNLYRYFPPARLR